MRTLSAKPQLARTAQAIAMKILLVITALLFFTQVTLGDINSELIKAATEGQTQTLETLIRGGADIQSDGGTTLIFAVYGSSTQTVSILIVAGADNDMADAGTGSGDGRTALSYAEEKNHAEITEVLRQAGAK